MSTHSHRSGENEGMEETKNFVEAWMSFKQEKERERIDLGNGESMD